LLAPGDACQAIGALRDGDHFRLITAELNLNEFSGAADAVAQFMLMQSARFRDGSLESNDRKVVVTRRKFYVQREQIGSNRYPLFA
jgi:hypothetical protein